jgi:hypothetical protein
VTPEIQISEHLSTPILPFLPTFIMSQSEDRPLSSSDFLKFTEGFNSTIEGLKTSIGASIQAAIAPLQVTQKETIEDLAKTKDRVTAIEDDNDSTKAKVEELQKQMSSLQQQNLSRRPPLTTRLMQIAEESSSVFRPTPPPPPPSSTPIRDAVHVLKEAKKVVGFSPITVDDINYLKSQHAIEDDATAMTFSIIEFLTFEMKVPKSFTDKLVLKRVFPPAKPPPSGWSTLYAEFPDTASADLIHQYVRNLLPGKNVSIYVPHSLHPRYSAIGDLSHEYRNGTIKHKTKIRYGASDFVLMVKPKNSNTPWSYVPLDGLPPLQLSSFDGNPSTSPPPGRTRITSKRGRPESPTSVDNTRLNKSSKDDLPDEPTAKDDLPDEPTA